MMRRLMTAAVAATCLAAAADGLTVARRGEPAGYAIVLKAKPSPSERFAAEELVKYLKKTTGETLAVTDDSKPLPAKAILVGMTAHTETLAGLAKLDVSVVDECAFRIAVKGPHVLLMGSEHSGAMYAAFEFLNRFAGVEWYSPQFEAAPARDAVVVPDDYFDTQKPAIVKRYILSDEVQYDPVFAAHRRLNVGPYRHTPRTGKSTFKSSTRYPIHTFELLVPVRDHFDAHPEYFSLVNGRRQKFHPQLCLTNPDVFELVVKRLEEELERDPAVTCVSVSQNDWNNWCTCPDCKAINDAEESDAGTMIRFANKVAKRLREKHPNVFVHTFAYQHTVKPPKLTKTGEGVIVQFCATGAIDQYLPLVESRHPATREYVSRLKDWGTGLGRVDVWDYTCYHDYYRFPFPNLRAMRENLRLYRDCKVFTDSYTGAQDELKVYAASRWLWNPDDSYEDVVGRFVRDFFGPAAPFVRAYLRLLEDRNDALRDPATMPMFYNEMPSETIYDGPFVEQCLDLWENARAAVKDHPDPQVRFNVLRHGTYADFMWLRAYHKEHLFWGTDHPEKAPGFVRTQACAQRLVGELAEEMKRGYKPRTWFWEEQRMSDCPYLHNIMMRFFSAYARGCPNRTSDVQTGFTRGFLPFDLDVAKRLSVWNVGFPEPDYVGYHFGTLRVMGGCGQEAMRFRLSRIVADPGVKMDFRVNLRVQRAKGAPDGDALVVERVRTADGAVLETKTFKAGELPEHFAWTTLMTVEPKADEELRFSSPKPAKDRRIPAEYVCFCDVDAKRADRVDPVLCPVSDLASGAMTSLQVAGEPAELLSAPTWGHGRCKIDGVPHEWKAVLTKDKSGNEYQFAYELMRQSRGVDFKIKVIRYVDDGRLYEQYVVLNEYYEPKRVTDFEIELPLTDKAKDRLGFVWHWNTSFKDLPANPLKDGKLRLPDFEISGRGKAWVKWEVSAK